MTEIVDSLPPGPERHAAAQEVVRRFTKYAAIGGLVPLVDLPAIAAVQLKMLEQLSHTYGLAFTDNLGKELVGTILGAGVSWNLGNALLMGVNQYIRFVPVAGQIFGLAVMPAFAAAATGTLGRIFVQHFESGGTLLDMDVTAAKSAIKSDFARAKRAPKSGGGVIIPATA